MSDICSSIFDVNSNRDIEFVMSIFVRGTDVDEQPENIKPKANYNAKDGGAVVHAKYTGYILPVVNVLFV